jgi:ABC-type glycerol-3-phosphate transport system substrate-binding protein
MSKPQLIFVGVVSILVIVLVLVFTGILPGLAPKRTKVNLTIWEVGPYSTQGALSSLKTTYPNVTYTVKSFPTIEEYESALLEAFSVGKAPDIFMVSQDNFPRFSNKIRYFPTEYISIPQLRQYFPSIVEQAFTKQGFVYALPLSIDTLSLIYNKDLLGGAGMTAPPTTWEQLKEMLPKLIKKDGAGNIVIAGMAIGGTPRSVMHAVDILSIIMLQKGTAMTSPDWTSATFASSQGVDALGFYTQFTDPNGGIYTWDDSMPPSIDAFSQEKLAMMLGYHEDVKKIREKNQYLNFDVAPLPQPQALLDAGKSMTYSSMYGYAISLQSKSYTTAWNIILGLTTNSAPEEIYLSDTKSPPALLSLINTQFNNVEYVTFSKQALVAKSWQKPNDIIVNDTFATMIESVITKKSRIQDALYQAISVINRLFSQ